MTGNLMEILKKSDGIYNPTPEKDMQGADPRLTVCEILRRIYAEVDNEDVKYLCRVATSLAKYTFNRVSKNEGRGWSAKVWIKNPDFEERFIR